MPLFPRRADAPAVATAGPARNCLCRTVKRRKIFTLERADREEGARPGILGAWKDAPAELLRSWRYRNVGRYAGLRLRASVEGHQGRMAGHDVRLSARPPDLAARFAA